jgi:hypothetical protein
MGSSVAVVKIFLIDRLGRADGQAKLRSNAGVQTHHKFLESALPYRKGEALLLHGERRPMTNLPARATSATSKLQKDAVG